MLPDGKLILGRLRRGPGHISLANKQPVLAAGEAKFIGGQLVKLNNKSGHYRPSGEFPKAAAEEAFSKAGL